MKTISELINQEPVFLNDWSNSKKDGVLSDFEVEDKNHNILFASYGYRNYEGDAWVLFEKGGKLYEVNGSHCSCYGLENQWDEEAVELSELENRITKGTFGGYGYSGNGFATELLIMW